MIITRIAPTPSGYLHAGNIANFVLARNFANQHAGKLWLRIDDCDSSRVRDEYLEDIFTTLDWLGIKWDLGPQSVLDFKQNYSQLNKKKTYWEILQKLPTFVCRCSRKDIRQRVGTLDYDGFCCDQHRSFVRGESIIRLD